MAKIRTVQKETYKKITKNNKTVEELLTKKVDYNTKRIENILPIMQTIEAI